MLIPIRWRSGHGRFKDCQLALGRLYNAAEFLDVESYTHLMDWTKKIDARNFNLLEHSVL